MNNIIFMGTPEFAVPSLAALHEAGYAVAAVYTQPDRPAGRGRKVTAPPVKAWAEEHGIPVRQPASLRAPAVLEELRALAPEAIAVAAYGKLLPEAVLTVPPKGVLNVHPSLLPKYRGPTPIPSAILAGDAVTGVTIMLLDAGMDTGPILAQREEPIDPGDTAESLGARLALLGGGLLSETLGRWLRGEVRPTPQDNAKATVSKLLEKDHGEIDWRESAEVLARKVRAYTPWPGAYTRWRGAVLKVLQAEPATGRVGEPGTVASVSQGIGVATGEGVLVLQRVQPEGSKQMAARDLVAGRRDFVGSRLPS